MKKKIPEVRSAILAVLDEHDGKCLDNQSERNAVAKAIYEDLCYRSYLYLEYDTVSQHADDEHSRRLQALPVEDATLIKEATEVIVELMDIIERGGPDVYSSSDQILRTDDFLKRIEARSEKN